MSISFETVHNITLTKDDVKILAAFKDAIEECPFDISATDAWEILDDISTLSSEHPHEDIEIYDGNVVFVSLEKDDTQRDVEGLLFDF